MSRRDQVRAALTDFADEHGVPNSITSPELAAHHTRLKSDQISRVGRRGGVLVLASGAVASYAGARWYVRRSRQGAAQASREGPPCVECDDNRAIPDDDGVTRPCPWCVTESQLGGDS